MVDELLSTERVADSPEQAERHPGHEEEPDDCRLEHAGDFGGLAEERVVLVVKEHEERERVDDGVHPEVHGGAVEEAAGGGAAPEEVVEHAEEQREGDGVAAAAGRDRRCELRVSFARGWLEGHTKAVSFPSEAFGTCVCGVGAGCARG